MYRGFHSDGEAEQATLIRFEQVSGIILIIIIIFNLSIFLSELSCPYLEILEGCRSPGKADLSRLKRLQNAV